MSCKLGDQKKRGACLEVVGDPGMAQIVDFGIFDPRKPEIAVNCSPDVSDK